ncbi:recombinase family protein [Neobacillus sp. MM2021_6]|uniref:recombinase family protein n=1 Tax=Bacillaceae TaxID=186817 RepID=UPI00140E4B85|nr:MULTISPECIES: recombinase family protein [Bacillaceae]MBO0962533.1 recombinase family protein [Neobacillus sp. MM2021_6]NHC20989.1 recombinase family protein [Bacillus sp. MM2020_4]
MYRQKGLDIFLYLRKSRADVDEEKKAAAEGRDYDTLARHRRNLFEVIKREEHNLIDTFEELVTGESIVERTEIQKMLKRMDQGEADAVLVMDVDRLGRGDMYDSGILDRAFRYNNIKLITPTEFYDPEAESWELVFGVKSIVARQELKSITKRLQGGRRDKARQGKSISKKPPYGYLRDENLKLYPDPETAWVVKKMFEMMRNGYGRIQVAHELDKLGIKPPDEKRELWSPSTITAIIKNEVYLGEIIWGKITYTKRGGKYKRKKMPPEEWIRKVDAHEPLVSQELFLAANRAHTGRYRPSTVTSKTLSNPLAGILKCEVCGYTMVHFPRKDRPSAMIRCPKPGCKGIQKGASFPIVEDRLLTALEEYVKRFEFKQQQGTPKETSNIPLKQKAFKKKQEEINELAKQKNNLHDLLEQNVYDVPTFMERQQNIVERIKKLESESQQLKEEIFNEEMKSKNVYEFIPKVKKVLQAYRHTSEIEKKNRLLKSILEKATFLRKIDWTKKDEFVIKIYPKI